MISAEKRHSATGACGAALAFEREFILLAARNFILLGEKFGGFAHHHFRNLAEEAVAIHRIHERLIAHLETPAAFEEIRHAAHGFRAACDDDFRFAGENLLPAESDGAQAGCARHIYGESGNVIAESGAPRDLPAGIRADSCGPRVADDDFVDAPR
jgi:hypothetical protein